MLQTETIVYSTVDPLPAYQAKVFIEIKANQVIELVSHIKWILSIFCIGWWFH